MADALGQVGGDNLWGEEPPASDLPFSLHLCHFQAIDAKGVMVSFDPRQLGQGWAELVVQEHVSKRLDDLVLVQVSDPILHGGQNGGTGLVQIQICLGPHQHGLLENGLVRPAIKVLALTPQISPVFLAMSSFVGILLRVHNSV
jgi:hypothetical protein